jgi:hypothetical protein
MATSCYWYAAMLRFMQLIMMGDDFLYKCSDQPHEFYSY